MIFADNPHDREIEKMMQKTPHFRPRGHGVFVSEKSEYNAERCGCKECADRKKKRRVSGEKTPCVEQRIHEGQIPQPRVLMETFTAVTNPEFIIRINGYIKECERKPTLTENGAKGTPCSVDFNRKRHTTTAAHPSVNDTETHSSSPFLC